MVGLGVAEILIISVIGLVLLLGLVLIIGVGGWFARQANRSNSAHEDPQEVLKRRLAAGEIDEETYERLRQRISED